MIIAESTSYIFSFFNQTIDVTSVDLSEIFEAEKKKNEKLYESLKELNRLRNESQDLTMSMFIDWL